MSEPYKLAIAGLGTVGRGVLRILNDNRDLIRQRTGRDWTVTAVSARDRNKDRGIDVSSYAWFDDPVEMASQADADVVVELIGGEGGQALAMSRAALECGRHVVTANKAMLAHHGTELAGLAEKAGKGLKYEAAVAGGIPIIGSLQDGLAANRVERVYGILNGTCNYILTQMEASGRSFGDVLADAQAQGYAEADPAFDIGGIDAAHKLSLLAALAFGMKVRFDDVFVEGIESIEAGDIEYARELGFRIKLLGVAQRTDNGIEQRVQPCLVPLGTPIAHVDGVYNAVVVHGSAVGQATFEGLGAGEFPTASSVVADLMDIARGRVSAPFMVPASELADPKLADPASHVGSFFVRLRVIDRPGVIASIAEELARESISIESLMQRSRAAGEFVPIVMVTHEVGKASITRALQRISGLDYVSGEPCLLSIEKF